MIKTFTKALSGEDSKRVWNIVFSHPEWFGEDTDGDALIHCHFYGLYTEFNELTAFYAVADWEYGQEKTICYVYVFEEYRKQGLFNKIIKNVKNTYTDCTYIAIGAREENKVANEIYARKFKWIRYSDEDHGNWYLVLERNKK